MLCINRGGEKVCEESVFIETKGTPKSAITTHDKKKKEMYNVESLFMDIINVGEFVGLVRGPGLSL